METEKEKRQPVTTTVKAEKRQPVTTTVKADKSPLPVVNAVLSCHTKSIYVSWQQPDEGIPTGYRVICLVKGKDESWGKSVGKKKQIWRCYREGYMKASC